MKKLLTILLTLLSFAALAQQGSLSQSVYKSRVNDTTAVSFTDAIASAVAAGYGYWFWNNQATTPHLDIYTDAGVEHVFTFAGSGGGGGATAAGATGNVQYKSAGGGLQAEAALTYDSATNTLDVDIVTVNTEAYDATGWDGDLSVPTKDAVRDKIETISNIITQASTSTAGGTIDLDVDNLYQKMFYGSATFSAAKALTVSDTTNAKFVSFFFEVTNVAATLTFDTNWYMSDVNFTAGVWTPPVTGKYEMVATKHDGLNIWWLKIIGPFTR